MEVTNETANSHLCSYPVSPMLFAYADDAGFQCQQVSEQASIPVTMELTSNVPNFLKGATITVRLKDGTQSTVPAEKFKVVPRKQQFVASVIAVDTKALCTRTVTNTVQKESTKNRLTMLAGEGPSGQLVKGVSGGILSVEEERVPVGGVQYQRLLNEDFSVGGQLQTNRTLMINFGVDF